MDWMQAGHQRQGNWSAVAVCVPHVARHISHSVHCKCIAGNAVCVCVCACTCVRACMRVCILKVSQPVTNERT